MQGMVGSSEIAQEGDEPPSLVSSDGSLESSAPSSPRVTGRDSPVAVNGDPTLYADLQAIAKRCASEPLYPDSDEEFVEQLDYEATPSAEREECEEFRRRTEG